MLQSYAWKQKYRLHRFITPYSHFLHALATSKAALGDNHGVHIGYGWTNECVYASIVLCIDFQCFFTLKVSAEDKASGKAQKITITSDKGRLSQDEIERMVKEAEENAEIDRIARQNVEAKNQLEAYLYSVRSTVNDSMKDKIKEEDKDLITKKVNEILQWVEENGSETKEAYDEKRKELESIASPIIEAVYKSQQNSSKSAPPSSDSSSDEGGSSSSSGDGPTVEEMWTKL